MRHYTGYDLTDKKLILTWFFDVAAIVSGVASIVIGQVCLQVDNVICTITGTGTVSGHDGQTFLEKIRR